MSAAPSSSTLALPGDNVTIAQAAELYVLIGLAPIPLYGLRADGSCACGSADCGRSAGKHPVGHDWQRRASLDLDVVRDRFRAHRGNVGIFLPLSGLVLLDADGDEGLQTALGLDLPATLTAQSGSGRGAHFLFRLAAHHDSNTITDRRVLPGLDVKIRGQFVAAPSRHPAGQYRWKVPVAPATLPDRIYEQICKPARPTSIASRAAARSDASLIEKRARAYVDRIPGGVQGQNGSEPTFAAARSLAGFLDKGLPESVAWSILCDYSARCTPPWSEKELAHKWTDAKAAHTPLVVEDRDPPATAVRRAPVPAPEASSVRLPPSGGDGSGGAGSPPRDDSDDWMAELLYSEGRKGQPKLVSHVDNVVRILQLAPEWRGKIRFDEFRSKIIVTAPPWDEYLRPTRVETQWGNEDAARMQAWMRRRFFSYAFDPNEKDIEKAVVIVAKTHAFHPIRDYLDTLEWDGTPRLASWLTRYLGAPETDYSRLVGTWWLLSAVARIYTPGEKVDTVPILEGAQGIRKSTALKVLCGDENFHDTPIDIGSKDAYTAIQGCWFVELAELDSLMRVEPTKSKAFFSSSKDRFRRAYARHESEELRQCIFVGTTNLSEYLRDPTGARRFWPIACTTVDVDALATDRDQLWAEAVSQFQDGRKWYPDTDAERDMLGLLQDDRTHQDAWETKIRAFLRTRQVATPDELLVALNLTEKDWTHGAQTRVGTIMANKLRWARRRPRRPDGSRYIVYVHPDCNNWTE